MIRGHLIPFVVAGVLAPALAPPAAAAVTVAAVPGLDGLSKPGRWTSVRVAVDVQGDDLDGELILDWGPTEVRRAIALPAPTRREFELYVRAAEVRDVIRVRLQSKGRDLSAIDVPIRTIGGNESVTICVAGALEVPSEPADCSATLPGDALPRSWRGYDAVDRVVWSGGGPRALAADQRRALDLWRSIRRSEEAGGFTPAAGVVPAAARPADRAVFMLSLYLGAIVAIGLAFVAAPRRARLLWPALVALAGLGAAAAQTVGRTAPVVVHHAGVSEQFAGASDALLTMRAVVEYPAFDRFALRTTSVDGAIDIQAGDEGKGESMVEHFDSDGYPSIAGMAGLGATRAFTVEAAGGFGSLRLVRDGRMTRLVNVSSRPLRDCELPPGFSPRHLSAFAPGQLVETTQPIAGDDPLVTCTLTGSPVEFVEARRRVVTDGTTTAIYHLAAEPARDDQP